MSDLLGSFLGCVRVRPKCAEKICVGLWGQTTVSISSHRQSVRPTFYKWYQSNLTTMANCVFNVLSVGKDPETMIQRGVVFLSGGECDTPNWNFKWLIDYSYQQSASSFHGSPFAKNSTVKHAWWGAILGWVTFEKFS